MRNIHTFVLILFLIFLASGRVAAQSLETYSQAVSNAKAHADAPAAWLPSAIEMVKVSTASSVGENPYGLKYYDVPANNQLIVRTLSSSNAYNGAWGTLTKAGDHYAIYGASTSMNAWVTTGKEMTGFIDGKGLNAGTVIKGLERGLGMNDKGSHDAIFEMAVTVGDTTNPYLLRPVRNPDPTKYSVIPGDYGTFASFPADAKTAGIGTGVAADTIFANFKQAYVNWAVQAYTSPFPWTQLGYTYYWGQAENPPANLSDVQGMTEFILLGGAGNADPSKTPSGEDESGKVIAVGIYSPQSYLYTKNDGITFSDAPEAQYGNGFASFNVTGPCNTLWAGRSFQAGAHMNAALPNTIMVGPGAVVSGGQGILIGSQNYTVINAGQITADADTKKFNVSGSENIAVLFKGDAHAIPYTGAVKNILTNSGVITAPGANGTAVAAWAGDTEMINSGVIAGTGTGFAVKTGPGDDTLTLNGGRIEGSIDLGTGKNRFNFTVNKDTASTPLIIKANTITLEGNTLAVKVAQTGNVRNNDTFLIADAAAPIVYAGKLSILGDASLPMITFTDLQSPDKRKLYFVATRDNSFYSRQSGNASLGQVLDTLANTATGDMAGVLGALDASGNPGNARRLEPNVDQGAIQASFRTVGQSTNIIMNRMEQVQFFRQNEIGMTGVSTGDEASQNGGWAQGFGSYLSQSATGLDSGYTANVWGVSFGYDTRLFEHLVAGFSGTFARNFVSTSDVDTRTDANSYQGGIYASLLREKWYLNGVLSFAYNRYDASRHIVFSGINRTAKSNYSGYSYSGYMEGGYAAKRNGWTLTPLLSLQMMRLELNDYTETEAGDLNLNVGRQRYNLFQTGLGAKMAYPLQKKNLRIIPELHAKWLYDFAGDPQQTTSTFTGGGAPFVTKGIDPPRSSGNIGAKLTFLTSSDWSLSLNYDLEMKTDYYSHNGWISLRYEF